MSIHLFTGTTGAPPVTTPWPADPEATQPARDLWDYLNGLKKRTNNKVLSGQRWMDYNQRIFNATGKWCALLNIGMSNSQDGSWANYCSDAAGRQNEMLNWWNAGGIVLYDIFLRDPVTKGPHSVGGAPIVTAAQADLILTEGHIYNTNLNWLLDKHLAILLWLQARGVPVLARNFIEHNGSGFWFLDNPRLPQLYRYCRKYLIDRGVHNVLWAHNVSHWAGSGTQGPPDDPKQILQFYPGDDIIDILSFDLYKTVTGTADYVAGDFHPYTTFKNKGKLQPVIIWEFGVKVDYNDTTGADLRKIINAIRNFAPDIVGWSCWSVTWSMADNNNVGELLADPWVITRDEVTR